MPNAANRRAFSAGGRPGRMSPRSGQFVQQGRVGGGGCGLGQGGELGFDLLAFVVQVGEPGADPGAHRGGSGVGRVGGQVFQFEDLGVLRGLDPPDPGLEPGGLGVPWAAASASVAGSCAASRAARPGPKIRVAKNRPMIWSSRVSGAWTVRGWSGWSAACLGVAGLCGHR